MYRQWGVRALAAEGRPDEEIRYAEASRGRNDNPVAIAAACEEILLASGRAEEAYRRYAEQAGRAGDARDRIRTLVASETSGERFVTRPLGRALGL